jgi:LPS sulfotransferase NodH
MACLPVRFAIIGSDLFYAHKDISLSFYLNIGVIIQKFVILSAQRSGSTLLMSLLDSHPNIECWDEIFDCHHHIHTFPSFEKYAATLDAGAIGFKLQYNQIEDMWGDLGLINRFNAEKYKIIHLLRKDKVRRAMLQRGCYEKVGDRIRIKIEAIKKKIAYFEAYASKYAHLADLTLYYEDFTAGKAVKQFNNPSLRKELLALLGVEDLILTTSMKKKERNLKEFIVNWEEVKKIGG